MRRRFVLPVLLANILVPTLSLAPAASAAEVASAPSCTQTATTTTTTPAGSELPVTAPPSSPSPGNPCWVDVNPYPFGSEGTSVQTPTPRCGLVLKGEAPGSQCALTVTSLAFRAWNRGLAATTSEEPSKNPYGVWLYNGSSWVPSPGFPGYSTCPGHTVVWAGKLDYWLIGGPGDASWSRLCRFDGSALEWEALELPQATKERISEPPGSPRPYKPGGITSAACLAWNNCWFFGTYGVILHWGPQDVGGRQILGLSDASPELSQLSLLGEYTAAVARPDLQGNMFGVAVGSTAQRYQPGSPSEILPEYEGTAPPEMWTSNGGPFSPDPFAPPTSPQEHDPYRTDLVAVDFDSAGEGWVAGNPAGLRASSPGSEARPASPKLPPPPSPLVPVSTSGANTTCTGPPPSRFTYTPPAFNAKEPPNSFLWSSIGVIPTVGEALVGGRLLPKSTGIVQSDLNAKPEGEPVIVKAACDGTTSVTRFSVEDLTYKGSPKPFVPADRTGYVSSIAANATNDAWAATTPGSLIEESGQTSESQPPHLYRLTDGLTPQAPEGDDLEERPLELQLDPPIIVLEPPPPLPPEPAPTTVIKTHRVKLLPAIFDVKAKLHQNRHNLNLYLSFRVRRSVTLGAQALRHGHIVSKARPRHFSGKRGLLILALDRKRWPTKIRFVS